MRNRYLFFWSILLLWAIAGGCKERGPAGPHLNGQQAKTMAKLYEIGFKCDGDPIATSPEACLSPGGDGCAYRMNMAGGVGVVVNGSTFGPYPAIDGNPILSE